MTYPHKFRHTFALYSLKKKFEKRLCYFSMLVSHVLFTSQECRWVCDLKLFFFIIFKDAVEFTVSNSPFFIY